MKNFILLLAFCAIVTQALLKQNPLAVETSNLEGQELFFNEQLLDHADRTQNQRWSQRYHLYDQYFNRSKGAVVLYICGEWTCNGFGSSGFVEELGQRYGALIIAIEHRYYGKSQPFGEVSLTPENIRYLNVHQALDDLAYFITYVKNNQLHGVTKDMPWITIGGSYPGGLSAWFRYKYPHLTVGALASSAVVNSIVDFPQFDEQIRESVLKSSQECADSIQALTHKAEEYLRDPNQREAFLKRFQAEKFTDGEFFFYLADIFVMQVQYGSRTYLCDYLLKNKTLDEQMNAIVNQAQYLDIESYSSFFLSDPTYDVDRNGRQWYYQTCEEVGWMQTAPQNEKLSMRSAILNIDFWKQWCHDSFGTDAAGQPLFPDSNETNGYFGGNKLNVRHLIMTNGSEDPWKRASLIEQEDNDLVILHIECNDCAHCVDLKTPKDSDPQNLKIAREKVKMYFDQWIGEHYKQIQQ